MLPVCPQELPEPIAYGLRALGRAWGQSSLKPHPSREAIASWKKLIDEWIAHQELPLFIRKPRGNRGCELSHATTGRKLVPTDNSPAQWVFGQALQGMCPTVQDIAHGITGHRIPVAAAFTGAEARNALHPALLRRADNLNVAGWRLCHIQSIGLKSSKNITERDRETLEKHFRLFLMPDNMFVIPKEWGALGEVPEFLAGFTEIRIVV